MQVFGQAEDLILIQIQVLQLKKYVEQEREKINQTKQFGMLLLHAAFFPNEVAELEKAYCFQCFNVILLELAMPITNRMKDSSNQL